MAILDHLLAAGIIPADRQNPRRCLPVGSNEILHCLLDHGAIIMAVCGRLWPSAGLAKIACRCP